MVTDEDVSTGSTVQRVGLIAFFEVVEGGVILVGDQVQVNGRALGDVAGFDETHMPNHQNICVAADSLVDVVALGLALGDSVRFESVRFT